MNSILEHEIVISEKFPLYDLSKVKGITFFSKNQKIWSVIDRLCKITKLLEFLSTGQNA